VPNFRRMKEGERVHFRTEIGSCPTQKEKVKLDLKKKNRHFGSRLKSFCAKMKSWGGKDRGTRKSRDCLAPGRKSF